jgi:signal recognition particle GTPase
MKNLGTMKTLKLIPGMEAIKMGLRADREKLLPQQAIIKHDQAERREPEILTASRRKPSARQRHKRAEVNRLMNQFNSRPAHEQCPQNEKGKKAKRGGSRSVSKQNCLMDRERGGFPSDSSAKQHWRITF